MSEEGTPETMEFGVPYDAGRRGYANFRMLDRQHGFGVYRMAVRYETRDRRVRFSATITG